jgi:hypothetical protein
MATSSFTSIANYCDQPYATDKSRSSSGHSILISRCLIKDDKIFNIVR